ncbi:MAG: DUF2064 domain-containing protein [Bacteroidetes bacterium]|jgi:rSAM/selenodomain-associated transferase 1|nr:DUF2064 domain-containing protein [Bacteroidota bacterium]
MSKTLLMVFIKNPVAGRVKTRLAASIGDANALQIYKTLLDYTRRVATDVNSDRQVWYSSKIDRRDEWSEHEFEKKLQSKGDLGERMADAFQQGFSDGYEKVVIIGSDCAELTAAHIEEAFRALDNNEAVIGPSEDGGYYLLGLSGYIEEVFRNVEWSTAGVFNATTSILSQQATSYEVLERLNDIDTIDDLRSSSLTFGAIE